MIYDSLSLNKGGGIISAIQQSEQSGRASLCIGIGGTGVAALAQLKRKVFQQLEPDDPDSPIPHYQHIQFLAIDSEETTVSGLKGAARLTDDEYFFISMPNLPAILKDKSSILNNPVMSWMEVDRITQLLSPQGAGGVRQVGRFLLLSKASELMNVIEQKCTTALMGTDPSIDVYVFAGLSGGTGGGCFIDTCYIIREVLKDLGLEGRNNIMGYFFLPDVMCSRPEVAGSIGAVRYNNENGYAALKELDYLMNLQDAQDWFSQDYGSFSIRTQKPPVDVCHLLSAQKADGTLISNGFGNCVNVSADDVLTCLAKVSLPEGKEDTQGLTMQGHLSCVTQSVKGLKREYGANLSYHILGIASAEVPLAQISTYLAAGFYRRFENSVGRRNVVITPDDVKTWAGKWGLTAEALEARMMEGCEPLNLPDVDKNVMKATCPVPANKSPEPWWTNGNAWLDQCSGKYTKNREALNGELTSNQVSKVSDGSLLGKVFIELCALAQDPNYGPYYAARLLRSETDDLRAWALGVRAQALEEAESLSRRLYSVSEAKAQASAELSTANVFNISRRYAAYKYLEESWYTAKNQQNMVLETARMAEKFADDLADLEKKFFTPLITVMDELDATFKENIVWLNSSAAKSQTTYTWRILELDDVKAHLDEAIDALTPRQLVCDFMQEFLACPDEWLQNDDGKIGRLINRYMEQVFHAEISKGLQDYLFLKHPPAPWKLGEIIQKEIITKVYNDATPIFWCDPKYAVTDPSVTFQSSSLSVPANAAIVCTAADQYAKTANNDCSVRKTGLKGRITARRLISGVPLFAYAGIAGMKKYYDGTIEFRGSIHLYSRTGRVTEGTSDVDWKTWLPVPLPYSFKPDLFEKRTTEAQLKLYEEGKQYGAIFLEAPNAQHPYTIYQLRLSKPIEVPEYKLEDFLTEGSVLNQKKLSEERNRLNYWLEHRYDRAEDAKYIDLKNDGNTALHDQEVMERVRRDYFLHYPVLQAKVAEEIKTYQAVKAALARLDELEAEHNHYEADLSSYCDGLFSNVFEVLNANKHSVFDPDENKKIAKIQYTYKDKREMVQVEVFSDTVQPKEYVFAEQYPLYQGFENYRALNPEEGPRHEMEEKVESFRQRSKEEADVLIARELEKIYSGERLDELFECIRELEPKERQDLTRFYDGLLRQIKRYKDNFALKVWRNAKASVAYAQTQLRFAAYLYCNNQQLELYSNYKNYAFNRTTNQWVQLPPDTPLYIAKNGQWVLTMTDAQGNVYPQ